MLRADDYLKAPLGDLLRDLANAAPSDVPAPTCMRLHDATRAYRGDLADTMPEDTRLPVDHPDVDVPGVVLESFLGGGGQGWVYAGRVLSSGKVVAVKVLPRGRGEDALGWGAREAILCARVRHRNVLRVLRAEPVGAFWVVLMELVQGAEMPQGRLAAIDAKQCFGQLADALLALADKQLVHRDIKPANILLRKPDGSPVLIDFGLAVDLGESAGGDIDLSGTPFFMAPEAWRDERPTPAWDAYALGVTAAVALVGPPNLPTDLPSLRQAKLSGVFERRVAKSLAAVEDVELRTWVASLLEGEPEARRAALVAARGWVAT